MTSQENMLMYVLERNLLRILIFYLFETSFIKWFECDGEIANMIV